MYGVSLLLLLPRVPLPFPLSMVLPLLQFFESLPDPTDLSLPNGVGSSPSPLSTSLNFFAVIDRNLHRLMNR